VNERYNRNLSARVSENDWRCLLNIIESGGFSDNSEAIRFALRTAEVIIKYAAGRDPNAVLIEQQYERGKVTLAEKMSPEDLEDILQHIREQLGPQRFDKMLDGARARRQLNQRNDNWFKMARTSIQNHSSGPYSYEDVADSIVRAARENGATISLQYAKTIAYTKRNGLGESND